MITDDVISKVANALGGEDAVKIVMALKDLKEATDDQLIPKTEMRLNDIRKILFNLYNHSIVQCYTTRDKDTGWFIFRWKLQPDQVEGFINNRKKQILKILKSRLEYEEKHDFYSCGTLGCNRVIFEDAVELIFRCPVCSKALNHSENSAMIKTLAFKINQLENQ